MFKTVFERIHPVSQCLFTSHPVFHFHFWGSRFIFICEWFACDCMVSLNVILHKVDYAIIEVELFSFCSFYIFQTGGGLQPPSSLLEFNPLAAFCNDVLMAFNELRLCAPLTLACDVSDLVQQSLMQACHCVLDYHR